MARCSSVSLVLSTARCSFSRLLCEDYHDAVIVARIIIILDKIVHNDMHFNERGQHTYNTIE